MSQLLKQSTAYTFRLGPFVDATDGFTPEDSLTIAATDVDISKAGGAYADKNESTALTGTGDANGYYTCLLNTTDTGTLGSLDIRCYVSGARPVSKSFQIVNANTYDSLVAGSDYLHGDVLQVNGSATTATFDSLSGQISSIGSGTGAALNFEADTDNTGGAIKSVTFVGSQTTGTYASTAADDTSNHVIDSSTNQIDIVYGFSVGSARSASKVIWKGTLSGTVGQSDTFTFSAYNFTTPGWDTRYVITNTSSAVQTFDIPLLGRNTGTSGGTPNHRAISSTWKVLLSKN